MLKRCSGFGRRETVHLLQVDCFSLVIKGKGIPLEKERADKKGQMRGGAVEKIIFFQFMGKNGASWKLFLCVITQNRCNRHIIFEC